MPRRYTVTTIHGSMIADGTITTNKLADQAVTTAKIADNAVTPAKAGDVVTLIAPIYSQAGASWTATRYGKGPAYTPSDTAASEVGIFFKPRTIKEMHIKITSISTTPATITLLKNSLDTAKAINVPGSTTGIFSETTTQVSYNVGDSMQVKFLGSSTTATAFSGLAVY
jgi:hypothetical protein